MNFFVPERLKLNALKNTVTPTAAVKVRADVPFGEWVTFWYETCCKPAVRPNTRTGYENNIRLYIRPRLGNVSLNKLTTNDLQQFINWMRKDGRSEYRESKGDGLSDNTVRHCYGLCRRALEKAVAEKLVSQNPAKECKLPSARRMEMRLLSREELQKLLIQARAEGYYEGFLLELTTGLRVGELMALRRWTGRCAITWPDGRLETRNVHAETEEECERLLAIMIAKMRTEVAAEKARLSAENRAS